MSGRRQDSMPSHISSLLVLPVPYVPTAPQYMPIPGWWESVLPVAIVAFWHALGLMGER